MSIVIDLNGSNSANTTNYNDAGTPNPTTHLFSTASISSSNTRSLFQSEQSRRERSTILLHQGFRIAAEHFLKHRLEDFSSGFLFRFDRLGDDLPRNGRKFG